MVLGLDVRQMRGQPGWFGYVEEGDGWVGLGEAKTVPMIHEFGHAHWGRFHVSGRPDLRWDDAGSVSHTSAMQQYHRDVLAFLRQPPDQYEPLRDRWRRLPEVSVENVGPLFHTAEADIFSDVAMDLDLLPPILRKYFDSFFQTGPFHRWGDAFAWYEGLSNEERRVADQYVGFQHYLRDEYLREGPQAGAAVPGSILAAVQREEEQRLADFAGQFDLFTGDAGNENAPVDFKFWRGYLRDKLDLHERYPDVLGRLSLARASQIAGALDVLVELDDATASRRGERMARALESDPFLVHFLPALGNRTLLDLFQRTPDLPSSNILAGTLQFVESLRRLAPEADRILALARKDRRDASPALNDFLERELEGASKDDIELFLELLRDADRELASAVTQGLPPSMVQRLLEKLPAPTRSLLDPEQLLPFLNVTVEAPAVNVAEGIRVLVAHPAGNFRIDNTYLDRVYKVLSTRGTRDPRETLAVIQDSRLPLRRFILERPRDLVAILRSDLVVAADVVQKSDPVTLPPSRFLYRLVQADPAFAARVVAHLHTLGEADLVKEAIAALAYDVDRRLHQADSPISLESDGHFLAQLLHELGPQWLSAYFTRLVVTYQPAVERGDVPGDFFEVLRRTLDAAIGRVRDSEQRQRLRATLPSMLR